MGSPIVNLDLHGMFREDAIKAFHDTICQWLESYGDRHYEIEIRFQDEIAAE